MKIQFVMLSALFALVGCQQAQKIKALPTMAPKASAVVFDIPSLINQDFASASSLLGKPASTEITDLPEGAARAATWEKSDGATLVIVYSPTSKKPAAITFVVSEEKASSDRDKVLSAGSLSVDSRNYSIQFLKQEGDKKKVVGATVKPLVATPSAPSPRSSQAG